MKNKWERIEIPSQKPIRDFIKVSIRPSVELAVWLDVWNFVWDPVGDSVDYSMWPALYRIKPHEE